MRPVYITGRGGLGDAIYARPFVREAVRRFDEVYVSTSWPDIFADLPVFPVKRIGGLALQAHHGDLAPASAWHDAPADADVISLRYRWKALQKGRSILTDMEYLSGLHPQSYRMDLPPLPPSPVAGRYAVVRPPTHRLDYPAPAREPRVDYLQGAADRLRALDYRVVTLASFVPGLEEPMASVPADLRYEHGELTLMQAFSVLAGAEVVVSGPSWMVPGCAAAGVPLVAIAGGIGGRNNPRALVDRRMGADIRWLLPDRFCMCRSRSHACPKEIRHFGSRLDAALGLGRKVAA